MNTVGSTMVIFCFRKQICFLAHLLAHKPINWDWLGKLSDELKRLYRGTELIVQKAVAHKDFAVETSRYRHEAELACIVVKPIPRYCKIHKRYQHLCFVFFSWLVTPCFHIGLIGLQVLLSDQIVF